MKTKAELKPNYAPVYVAALYPDLCQIFHSHGYALAVHGSCARDFDLIAVPWVETVSAPEEVVEDVLRQIAVHKIGEFITRKHGRRVISLACGFGNCFVDLSFIGVPVKEVKP